MKKTNILIISVIAAVALFMILTVLQNKMTKNEPMTAVYIANFDMARDTAVTESMYKQVLVPTSLVLNTDAVTDNNEIVGKYVKDTINKGQIIFKQDIAKKEELKIVEAEYGLERIAVKVKAGENAVAYQIKPKDRIHLYFTGRSGVIKNTFLKYGIKFDKNMDDNSYQTEKIIEDVEILGIYDEVGRSCENSEFSGTDTIVIAVEANKAEIINNLRLQGTFDITR